MGEWKPISSAPKDREIELRVRRKVFPAKYDFICWKSDMSGGLNDDEQDRAYYGWCATTDDYPSDWDDGVCWFVNGDGRRSSRPSAWRETPPPKD